MQPELFHSEFTHLAKYVYNYIETLPALNASKLTIKILEQRHQNDVINIVLVSLVLNFKTV